MRRNLDNIIWIFTFIIIAIGLVALYSASFQNVRVSIKVFYDQLFCSLLGIIIMFYLSRTDYRKFYDIAHIFYAIVIFLLILVLVSGRHALGAQRWLVLWKISFQPSEVAKLALILILARYFNDRRPAISFSFSNIKQTLWSDLGIPLILTLVPMYLIFKQPDLGTALLFFGIFIVMVFVSGLEYHYFFGFLGICTAALPFAWNFLKSYQKDRLMVFLNPNIDPLGAGYTIIQSKIAIGSGKLAGKGWLSGTQNQLNFLPERHTDFIFSVVGEEWGLVGTLLLLVCFLVIIYCGLKISERIKDKFGMQLAIGIIAIFTLQVVINIGMVMGLCPVVGLTLPLISYGRTSFIVFMIMMGMLLSLSKRRTIF